MPPIAIELNARRAEHDVEPTTLLVDLIRGPCGLTGTHVGCDTAQCGACTVLVDGRVTKSCSLLAVQAQGAAVTTVEGLPGLAGLPAGALHPLQEAFMDCHGLQCGFCTPGMLMAAAALLQTTPLPDDEQIAQALEGNLCRCTGYVNIIAAVRQAAHAMAPLAPGLAGRPGGAGAAA